MLVAAFIVLFITVIVRFANQEICSHTDGIGDCRRTIFLFLEDYRQLGARKMRAGAASEERYPPALVFPYAPALFSALTSQHQEICIQCNVN